ncbi:MAG TPA: CHASE3 domain-containing protein, partial [Chthonomonadales bacterium]|nr:CHASE3 domain-containing protein [Chthonomonadales bacterium]
MAALLVALIGGITVVNTRDLIASGESLSRSREALTTLEATQGSVSDAEAAANSFVATGEDSYLRSFEVHAASPHGQLQQIAKLTGDTEVQRARIALVRTRINAELTILHSIIAARKARGFAAAWRSVQSPADAARLADVRDAISELEQAERNRSDSRLAEWQLHGLRTLYSAGSLAGVVFILLCSVFGMTAADAHRREQNEAMLRKERERLAAIVETQYVIATAERNVEAIMELVTRRTQKLVNADAAIVELADGDQLVNRAASGAIGDTSAANLSIDRELSGASVRTGQIQICDDSETDDQVDRAACAEAGIRSIVVVPFRLGGEVGGVI